MAKQNQKHEKYIILLLRLQCGIFRGYLKLTEHFTLEEMVRSSAASMRGIVNTPGANEIANLRILCEKILEPARMKLGMPITVTSGYRSFRLNRVVGGAKGSLHLVGKAADITCSDNARLYEVLQKLLCFELITYRYKGPMLTGRINRFHVSYNGVIGGSSRWFIKWI